MTFQVTPHGWKTQSYSTFTHFEGSVACSDCLDPRMDTFSPPKLGFLCMNLHVSLWMWKGVYFIHFDLYLSPLCVHLLKIQLQIAIKHKYLIFFSHVLENTFQRTWRHVNGLGLKGQCHLILRKTPNKKYAR